MEEPVNSGSENTSNPFEKEDVSRESSTRKIGSFALRVAEVIAITGAAYASQELIYHDSLPLAVNVAIAGGSSAMSHGLFSKK